MSIKTDKTLCLFAMDLDCVMETEKMIRRPAALSEAGLRDLKDIMIL